MVAIDVTETSGVDHPAHLHEGWVVCKSATREHVEALFGSLNTRKGTDVPNDAKGSAGEGASLTVEDLQKALAAMTTERDEAVAKAAAAATAKPVEKSAEQEQEEMLKALPEAVRAMLAKSAAETEELRKAAAVDRENFEKERDARLDQAAVTDFENTFKSLALDAAEVAPALRRVGVVSPELAKSIETALKAADGQLESASIFKEIGRGGDGGNGGSALDKIKANAEELRKSETGLSAEAAFAKAVDADPALYSEYLAEMAGK
jgi:hypothetical protein